MGGRPSNGELNKRQKQFCHEYLVDQNGTKAAIRVGYSAKTAESQASRLLTNVKIMEYLSELGAKQVERLDLKADKVIRAIEQIAYGDIRPMFTPDGALLLPHEWDDDTAAAVAGLDVVTVSKGEGEVEYVTKIKRTDRLRALDMLARYHALYNDKLEVTVNESLSERLARAKQRQSE
jgi:phage terminase small subunit